MNEPEPVGYDGQGAALYQHQLDPECASCGTSYPSPSAANECCGRWDGKGWD